MPTFRHAAASLACALLATLVPAAPILADTALVRDTTTIYDSASQALSTCGGVSNVGAATLDRSSAKRPYVKVPANLTTGPAIFAWAADRSRVSTGVMGYLCISSARANGYSEEGNAADAQAQLQKYGQQFGTGPQTDPKYGIWHTADRGVAATTCSAYSDKSLIVLDLHAAAANASVKQYVTESPGLDRFVAPGLLEYSCRALAANGWVLVNTVPEAVPVNTVVLGDAQRMCSVKASLKTADGSSWGTVESFAQGTSAGKTYFVYDPAGADPAFDAKRAGYTCLGDIPLLAKVTPVTLASFERIVSTDFSAAHPHASPTPAPAPVAPRCGAVASWPVKNIDTSGFKIADDDACTFYVVAPVNVHRNGDSTLSFFGHTVRRGTLNFPGSGYYFKVPASGVSDAALRSGRISAVQIRGAGYVDAALLHRTSSQDVLAILPVGGWPIMFPAGVINAGAYNLIPSGNAVINAGAYNFTQSAAAAASFAQMQGAGVIAAGAFN